ncbi:stalk domain-containing protein [Brevibacillus laterosporus]|uniref:copper amine oxidase N-terminal domain-containing protein n=1 Tax=Brevibacillus laterosporus TaxID=1465 RepID=UPI0018CDF75C|nr:copper amine oxidase N-terminal domain-containing protein [Brevibacillus laterosporus]MBG9786816.1 peptidase [Brevibacillus laterosporus]MCG7316330.1 stalk domain-containing protein [Brevibacillus laterosporus]MED1788125.1 stalk domain-containing protein [Brevibacillus laterosporus]
MFKKKAILVLSSALLIGALPATTDAAVMKKNVQATYNNVKVKHNGYEISTPTEPFIVNGTTYIPIRMMADVFNKNVDWDQATYTVSVTDRDDPTFSSLRSQIATKDAKIADLERELRDAQDELDKKSSKNSYSDDLDDLEDDIQEKYGDWEDIDWDITLYGDEDDIEITIEFDRDEDGDLYDDLDEDDLKDFVTKICKMVWKDSTFEDADIEGTITDTDEDEDLYDFKGKASTGKITLTEN